MRMQSAFRTCLKEGKDTMKDTAFWKNRQIFGEHTTKKVVSFITATMLFSATVTIPAFAETATNPPAPPNGAQMQEGQTPPEMPQGGFQPGEGMTPPDKPDGQPGGGMGTPGGMMGGPGGGASAPTEYAAVNTYAENATLADDTLSSTGTDENAVLVTDGNVTVSNMVIDRTSSDSTGGDQSSFYGVGAAVLATGGNLTVSDTVITTDSQGGAGVFSYGNAVVTVNDTTIATAQNTSGGIHVAGGGTLYANNVTVSTQGESSAAIRSDRGGGTMIVNGGSFTANGTGSPAVYVTADITVSDADLTATGSEAVCIEGMNSLTLNNCNLTGSMPDLSQNEVTWTVILYQSMSGDSQIGCSNFNMEGGTLTSTNGGLFYTTNTESTFTLNNVAITAADDSEFFLRVTGNANQRGWGTSGANGADCTFTGVQQEMNGDIQWDSISTLTLHLTEGSVLTGAIVDDESCAGNGGDGWCKVTIDAASAWIVTGDSVVTALDNQGTITDAEGNAVTVLASNGDVISEGNSAYTITVMGK